MQTEQENKSQNLCLEKRTDKLVYYSILPFLFPLEAVAGLVYTVAAFYMASRHPEEVINPLPKPIGLYREIYRELHNFYKKQFIK